jgi:hypothetical protein
MKGVSRLMRPNPSLQSAPIVHAVSSVTLGVPIEHGALRVTPLLGDDEAACDYVTLDEALPAGLITITEVSDEGRVPELRVRNSASKPVLILDGEELVGAKQNRVLNLTVLIGANTETTIPVSCVESGRWRHATRHFMSSPYTMYASGRAEKMTQVAESMRVSGARLADQGAVWDSIAVKSAHLRSRSATHAMAAMYEQHARMIDECVTALPAVARQRGAIFSVHGRPAGIELFDRAETARLLMPKLVRSYAIDALDERPDTGTVASMPSEALLTALAHTEARVFAGVGEGRDVRLEGQSLVGAALIAGDRVVHLAAFSIPEASAKSSDQMGAA